MFHNLVQISQLLLYAKNSNKLYCFLVDGTYIYICTLITVGMLKASHSGSIIYHGKRFVFRVLLAIHTIRVR